MTTASARSSGSPAVARGGVPSLPTAWLREWGAVAQLAGDLLVAGPYLAVFGVLVGGLSSVPAFGVGVLLVVPSLWVSRFVGAFERIRLEAFTGVAVPPPAPPRPGRRVWRRLLLDARAWRAAIHLTVIGFWGVVVGTATTVLTCVLLALAAMPAYAAWLPHGRMALPFGDVPATPLAAVVGVLGLLALPFLARGLVGVDVALARTLLGPGGTEQVAELTQRVETLNRTREMTVDSVELERRRIERDLHDGPQQRLVALAMDLGMARTKLDGDPSGARELLDKAHAAAKEAIVEMRQVARGIHPPVLTDRGLDAALSALAARSPVPVAVRVDLDRRPSPTAEAIAYFCVSEALTNVAKHSGASSAAVTVRRAAAGGRDALHLVVDDDGRGGADPTRGTGLAGLRQRLAAVDGTLAVSSPPGGGTHLTMILPEPAPRSDP